MLFNFLATDEKTGAPDDWGRGHLFRSGRSGYSPISKRYLIKELPSVPNYDVKSGDIRYMENNLYNKVCQTFNKGYLSKIYVPAGTSCQKR